MKKLNIYDDNEKIDKAWFDSSNIVYAECKDNKDELKTVTVVFSTGSKYVYYGVDVNDWIKFRESDSQGKALNMFISKKDKDTKKPIYEYRRLEDINVNEINEEYNKLTTPKEYTINPDGFMQQLFGIINDMEMSKKITDAIEKIASEHNGIYKIIFK